MLRFWIFLIPFLALSSRAEEPAAPIAPAPAASSPGAESPAKPSKTRNPKGKRPREKEIEGTEARDRFQADTVLKSKYQYNGEPLEVDPD